MLGKSRKMELMGFEIRKQLVNNKQKVLQQCDVVLEG